MPPAQLKHFVAAEGRLSSDAIVTEAYVNGTPVHALCGSVFVPSRDPNLLPECVACANMIELDCQ